MHYTIRRIMPRLMLVSLSIVQNVGWKVDWGNQLTNEFYNYFQL
jgi:hypothetical protein